MSTSVASKIERSKFPPNENVIDYQTEVKVMDLNFLSYFSLFVWLIPDWGTYMSAQKGVSGRSEEYLFMNLLREIKPNIKEEIDP